MTVLRDGRRVHTGPVAEITRLELVSRMLGREVCRRRPRPDALQRATTRPSRREPVLRATDLTRRHVLDRRVGRGSRRRGRRSGRPPRIGPDARRPRPSTARSRSTSGSVEVGGDADPSWVPRGPRSRPASPSSPRTARPRGSSRRCRCATTSSSRPCRRCPGRGFVSERRQDAVVERLMTRLRIKASGPDQRVGELSGGNQQKVLLARVLCLEPRVLHPRRSDPRHRRRREGRDPGARSASSRRRGLAVVLISSELEEVVEGSDTDRRAA